MKILTQKQYERLLGINVAGPRSKNQEVINQLARIPIGKALLITQEDWHAKTELAGIINQYFRNQGTNQEFKTHTVQDKEGNTNWVAIRIK